MTMTNHPSVNYDNTPVCQRW